GNALACDHFRFSFRGKSAHAASNPEHGINALDAVLLTFHGISALRQQLPSSTRVHGIITQGGLAANVIPEFAQAEFMVRAPSRKELESISRRVLRCARGAARASGCRLKVEPASFPCDEIWNNPALVQQIEQAMHRQEIDPILPEDQFPGSSDFGSVSHFLPSAYAFLATAPAGVELHSRQFARSTVTPRAEEALSRMVRILAEVGAAFLLDPKLREEVKAQFLQQTSAAR
ncbi:MAG: peptidase dimerization domain-containing protein, partial [Coprothermobacterota bacterium]|nr:peptidase dimerization domain-containing protein [Coprothermobacterota bacterium]